MTVNGAFPRDQREHEAARRLVLLSARDIEDATRLMKLLVEGHDSDVIGVGDAGRPQPPTRETLIEAARSELARRNRRRELFPHAIFGEPAWEMALLLYTEQHRTRLNIAQISSNLRIPGTSTLRWLNYLEENELVERDPNPLDQRSAFLRLTAKAIQALDLYFSEALLTAR